MLSFIIGESKICECVAEVIFLIFFALALVCVAWLFEQLRILTSKEKKLPFNWISKHLLKKRMLMNYSSLFFQLTLVLLLLCFIGSIVCWFISRNSLSLALTGFLPLVSISGVASAVLCGNKESVTSRYLQRMVKWYVYDKLIEIDRAEKEDKQKIIALVDHKNGKFILKPQICFPLQGAQLNKEYKDIFMEMPDVHLSRMIISENGVNIDIDCINGTEIDLDFCVQVGKSNQKEWEMLKKFETENLGSMIQISLIYAYTLYYYSEEGSFELSIHLGISDNRLRIREIYGKER